VLIPRPETEHLVVRLLDLLSKDVKRSEPPLVADVGAGSGIIAICAAKHHPNCRVIAVDISPAALAIARQNAQTHGVESRIEFVQGNLLEGVPATAEFDIVASNPPYVSTAEFERLSSEVRGQEPRSSLEAGPRGTEVIERLVPQAAERLRAGGWFLCEISPMISEAVMRVLASESRLEPGPMIHDLAGHPRIVQARKKA
jgi:release factor glutamine methyltransferase